MLNTFYRSGNGIQRAFTRQVLNTAHICALLCTLFLLSGCPPVGETPIGETPTPSESPGPAPLVAVDFQTNMRIYEVFPYRWSGPNYFGSIQADLPRIKALGFNTLWFTPLYVGDGMGYHPQNYSAINPDYGTEAQLKALIDEAHRLGFKAILDQVFNHSDVLHPWFQDAITNKSASPYIDYYLWDGTPGILENAQHLYDGDGSWGELPNLNVANSAVQTQLINSSKYWLQTFDFDGFRCDVAWGVEQRSSSFWQALRSQLTALKPEIFLLGEAPTVPASIYESVPTMSGSNLSILYEDRFDALYDWELRPFDDTLGLIGALKGLVSLNVLNIGLSRNYPEGKLPFRFVENHDTTRVAALTSGTAGSKLAHSLILTVPGIPLIFAGAETGQISSLERVCPDTDGMTAYITKVTGIRNDYISNDSRLVRLPNDRSNTVYSYVVFSDMDYMTVAVLNFSNAGVTAAIDISSLTPYVESTSGLTDLIANESLVAGSVSLAAYGVKVFVLRRNASAIPEDFGQPAEPSANILLNGDFSNGTSNWSSYIDAAANASGQVISGSYSMAISNGTADSWRVQLLQGGIELVNGRNYTLSFLASASTARSINAILRMPTVYTQYGIQSFNLSTTPSTYSFTFSMNAASDSSSELVIEMGGANIGVTLDDFSLTWQ